MPAPWVAWKRILSCKQETGFVHGAIHDPTAASTCGASTAPSTPKTPGSTTRLVSSSGFISSSSAFNYGHHQSSNKKKKNGNFILSVPTIISGTARPAMICCSDTLKNVIHGNTTARVAHTESPLPQYLQSHQNLHQQYNVSNANSSSGHGQLKYFSASPTQNHQTITIQSIKDSIVSASSSPNPKLTCNTTTSLSSSSFKENLKHNSTPSSYGTDPQATVDQKQSPAKKGAMIKSSSVHCTPHLHHQRSNSILSSRHSLSSNSFYASPCASLSVTCQKCGEAFQSSEFLEEHQVTYHSVTELKEGDSARSIVEIIFQTRWLRPDLPPAVSECIFKVHNSPKTVAKFEEYRDIIKAKASKISKKHSRCLVDGNELLRFYSTTISCDMGQATSSSSSPACITSVPALCTSAACGVCHILRNGFPIDNQPGIFTNASSGKAHDSAWFGRTSSIIGSKVKSAMLVCRVIAGRVKRMGLETSQDGLPSAYDSAAGEPSSYTDLEELLVFNTTAVLPCFIVIYNCQ